MSSKVVSGEKLNTKTWLLWLSVSFGIISFCRNPFYLLIIMLIVSTVFFVFGSGTARSHIFRSFLKFGLGFMAVSIVFNLFTVHQGETVLFFVRENIPVLGGRITFEALLFGFTFGLSFFCALLLFAVFNIVLDQYEVLRMIPSFLRRLAVTLSIAFVFVPQTFEAAREIRESQMMRGYDFRGSFRSRLTSFSSQIFPLIISGLEKAIVLSESMESRAYGAKTKGSIYRRPAVWRTSDKVVVLTSLLTLFIFAVIIVFHGESLYYSPYPKAYLPDFNPFIGVSLIFLLSPVVTKR